MMYLQCGSDYFSDLEHAGIVPKDHEPTRVMAEETWHRIGHDVLAHMEEFYRGYHPPERPIWAEREFGAPGGVKRRAGR